MTDDATAFAHRKRRITCSVVAAGFAQQEYERYRSWVDTTADRLRPFGAGAYVNFLDAAGEQQLGDAYPLAILQRLADVKSQYDPTNRFRRNLNIPPDTGDH